MTIDKNKTLELVVTACENKKAENCIVLNMQNLTALTDYYVICHASNERQVQAIARSVKDVIGKETSQEVKRMEGFQEGRWILVDLGNIVCHIFHQEERAHYNLEKLWGDAEIVDIKGA